MVSKYRIGYDLRAFCELLVYSDLYFCLRSASAEGDVKRVHHAGDGVRRAFE